jgi:hypothetical protein
LHIALFQAAPEYVWRRVPSSILTSELCMIRAPF